jgi:hypothetical protein
VYPRYLWVLLTTNKEEVSTRSSNECGIDLTTDSGWELNLGYLRHQTGTAVAIRVDGTAAPEQAHPYPMDYPVIPARQVADAFHSDTYSKAFWNRSSVPIRVRQRSSHQCKGPINLGKGFFLVLLVTGANVDEAKDVNPFSAPVDEVGACVDRLLGGHKIAPGDTPCVTEAEVHHSWILAVLLGPRGLEVERSTLLRHFLVCTRPVA